MLLVVDNGSVYTKNLIDVLNKKNIANTRHTPESLQLESLGNYDSIILSGRRKNEKIINRINSKVIGFCIKNNKKLLGICYGAEILALYLGGTIKKSVMLQKGNETVEIKRDNPISEKTMNVFESHGFEISKLPETLRMLAKSENCQYEIIQYGTRPIFGTQFHPEMSQDGQHLIEKFCML